MFGFGFGDNRLTPDRWVICSKPNLCAVKPLGSAFTRSTHSRHEAGSSMLRGEAWLYTRTRSRNFFSSSLDRSAAEEVALNKPPSFSLLQAPGHDPINQNEDDEHRELICHAWNRQT